MLPENYEYLFERYKIAQLRYLHILETPTHPSHTNIVETLAAAIELKSTSMTIDQIIYERMIKYARQELKPFTNQRNKYE